MRFCPRPPNRSATVAISRLPVVFVLIVVAVAGIYLLVGSGAHSGSSCSTSPIYGGPVHEVFQPNWQSLPIYNLTASSLPSIIRSGFSVDVTKSFLQIAIAMPETETGQFVANVTVIRGIGDLTYALGPGRITPQIPASLGAMSFTYAISVPGGTPDGHYEVDLNLNPVNAGCRDVGTQLPIQINIG